MRNWKKLKEMTERKGEEKKEEMKKEAVMMVFTGQKPATGQPGSFHKAF